MIKIKHILYLLIILFLLLIIYNYKNKSLELESQNINLKSNLEQINNINNQYAKKIRELTIIANMDSSYEYFKDIMKKDMLVRIHNKLIKPENANLVVYNILKYSKKYNLNPLIVYAVISQESSFIHTIIHNDVIVRVYDKKIKTNAIGLGGVVYEVWEDKLKNIVKNKDELFKIDRNIEAVCFILNEFKKLKPFKNRTKTETMLLRYFGGNHPNYLNNINLKILNLIERN